MTGYSGTSKTGKLHTYYKCKNNECKTKPVQKDYVENLVVNSAQEFLTNDNINYVSKEIVIVIKGFQSNSNLKKMQSNYNNLEKNKRKIVKSIYDCNIENIKKNFYQDLADIEEEMKQLSYHITKEADKYTNITTEEFKFFLKKLRKGSIANFHYKKSLINTLINKVLLYNDKMTIIFNINQTILFDYLFRSSYMPV